MKITTWNVNSLRARMPRFLPWLRENRPDVLCLQETKVVDDLFPRAEIEEEGYNVACFGQKTYNGVAILSRTPLEDVHCGFPGDGDDAEKRAIRAIVGDVVVLNLYVPNGSSVGSDKFAYKMDWLQRLRSYLAEEFDPGEKVVVTGDFNITFDDRDVWDPEGLREAIHCSTQEREALAQVMEFGLHDGLRKHQEEGGVFTWWDHRGGAFWRNQGLRIDHFLLSGPALEACTGVTVDRDARKGKGPSDHVPVTAEFE